MRVGRAFFLTIKKLSLNLKLHLGFYHQCQRDVIHKNATLKRSEKKPETTKSHNIQHIINNRNMSKIARLKIVERAVAIRVLFILPLTEMFLSQIFTSAVPAGVPGFPVCLARAGFPLSFESSFRLNKQPSHPQPGPSLLSDIARSSWMHFRLDSPFFYCVSNRFWNSLKPIAKLRPTPTSNFSQFENKSQSQTTLGICSRKQQTLKQRVRRRRNNSP